MSSENPADQHAPVVSVGALSIAGKVRDENQDRMSRSLAPLGDLYIVADGMGGYQGGALAARIAVETVERVFQEAGAAAAPQATIQKAIQQANAEIRQRAASGAPECEKMGSTIVVLLVRDGVAHIGHVGDSRAYLFHEGKLRQLTTDHTMVQGLVDGGILTPEQARDHPESSTLSRVLGPKAEVEADLEPPVSLQPDDAILLCSDGLSGYVTDAEIQQAIHAESRVQGTADRLVNLAMNAGGEDNITVQFVRYGKSDPPKIEAQRPLMEVPGVPAVKLSTAAGGPVDRGLTWKVVGAAAVAAVLASAATVAYMSGRSASGQNAAAPAESRDVSAQIRQLQNEVDRLKGTVGTLDAWRISAQSVRRPVVAAPPAIAVAPVAASTPASRKSAKGAGKKGASTQGGAHAVPGRGTQPAGTAAQPQPDTAAPPVATPAQPPAPPSDSPPGA